MDYEDQILEQHDYLIEEFEEENGRPPTKEESMKLYDDAKEYVDERACAYGDYLRKVGKGE